ncbi:hypothetical protein DERF_000823 [Dermatophagoides farinae]|uniref:Uncharacterized protein n=1 Tax=Dermatophagoides farinae TaxID=6954 RepID=A0A922IAN7_DERFA|nr:hypothetical protein DERF_000823 [Dermatophagoides farinae]
MKPDADPLELRKICNEIGSLTANTAERLGRSLTYRLGMIVPLRWNMGIEFMSTSNRYSWPPW